LFGAKSSILYSMFSGNLIIQTQTDFESIDLQYRTQLVMVSTRLSMACLVRTGSTTRVTTWLSSHVGHL
jgi:hypothetical protein